MSNLVYIGVHASNTYVLIEKADGLFALHADFPFQKTIMVRPGSTVLHANKPELIFPTHKRNVTMIDALCLFTVSFGYNILMRAYVARKCCRARNFTDLVRQNSI